MIVFLPLYPIEKTLQENKNGTSEENFDLCRSAGEKGTPFDRAVQSP